MMMKLAKGGIRRLIAFLKESKALSTLVAIILILNMIIAASVAWFTLNRQTNANQIGMELAIDDTTAVYKTYMYDLKEGKGTDLAYDEDGNLKEDDDGNPVYLDITNLDLNQYDTIFRAQNKYTPAIAKIEITGNQSMPKNGTVHITINGPTAKTTHSDIQQDTVVSSILRFTALVFPADQKTEVIENDKKVDKNICDLDAEHLYKFISLDKRLTDSNGKAVSQFDIIETMQGNEDKSSQTFVTIEAIEGAENGEHNHVKADSIIVSIDYDESMWHEEDNKYILCIYLYITYDANLIKCFMETLENGSVSLDDDSVKFENDLDKISVSYSNKED